MERHDELISLPRFLALLSGTWTLSILCTLNRNGPTPFGQFRKALGEISTKTLTERLRRLEAEGLVSRHYESTVPPQAIYTPTERLAELRPVLLEIERLGRGWYGPGETISLPEAPELSQRS